VFQVLLVLQVLAVHQALLVQVFNELASWSFVTHNHLKYPTVHQAWLNSGMVTVYWWCKVMITVITKILAQLVHVSKNSRLYHTYVVITPMFATMVKPTIWHTISQQPNTCPWCLSNVIKFDHIFHVVLFAKHLLMLCHSIVYQWHHHHVQMDGISYGKVTVLSW